MFGFLYNKLRRITTNELYFPEIDGIRFLAIFMVILFHIHGFFLDKSQLVFADRSSYPLVDYILVGSDKGVQLFFVLSSFILCLPFAHHYINGGKKVELKKYFLRRLTRLEPPYFIAMIALFFATLAMGLYSLPFLLKSLGASLVYMHNILFQHKPYITVVAWSLEIEIQFYVIAPLLFKVLKLNKYLRRSLLVVAALIFPFLQYHYQLPFESLYKYIQYFLFGILLADLYVSGAGVRTLNNRYIAIIALILICGIFLLPFKERFYGKVVLPFFIFGLYMLILRNDVVKKVFSYKFIPIIGGMCYSIYLLHYPVISLFGRFTIGWKFTDYYIVNLIIQVFLLVVPILLICSAYYYFIERPFMSKKWLDKLIKKDKHQAEINAVTAPLPEKPLI